MVRLDRIYTRSGDDGETGLGDGSRASKLSPRIIAGGSVDELNCVLGLACAESKEAATSALLLELQQRLFDLGADLSCPFVEHDNRQRLTNESVSWLEAQIDAQTEQLAPLTSFILPGGTKVAAYVHHARAICRRAELDVLRLCDAEPNLVNPVVSVFLNRFSDLLFVLARAANNSGADDVLWRPRRSQD